MFPWELEAQRSEFHKLKENIPQQVLDFEISFCCIKLHHLQGLIEKKRFQVTMHLLQNRSDDVKTRWDQKVAHNAKVERHWCSDHILTSSVIYR